MDNLLLSGGQPTERWSNPACVLALPNGARVNLGFPGAWEWVHILSGSW